MNEDWVREQTIDEIEDCKTQQFVLIFYRDRCRWSQRFHLDGHVIRASFLRDVNFPQLGNRVQSVNDIREDERVQLEEQGFASLKKLMKGETVKDHFELEWTLVP